MGGVWSALERGGPGLDAGPVVGLVSRAAVDIPPSLGRNYFCLMAVMGGFSGSGLVSGLEAFCRQVPIGINVMGFSFVAQL